MSPSAGPGRDTASLPADLVDVPGQCRDLVTFPENAECFRCVECQQSGQVTVANGAWQELRVSPALQVDKTEPVRVDHGLGGRLAGLEASSCSDRAGTAGGNQVNIFCAMFILADECNQGQHVVNPLGKQRVVVCVGVGRNLAVI